MNQADGFDDFPVDDLDIPDHLRDALEESGVPHATLAVMMELSQLRSSYVVGRALWERFPTEDAWIAALNHRDTRELVDEFAEFLSNLRTTIEFGPALDPEGVQEAVMEHYERALDAVKDFADYIGVDGPSVLSVLINTPGSLES